MLHLQLVGGGIVAVVAAEHRLWQLAQDVVNLRTIAALGDDTELQRGMAHQAVQIDLVVGKKRRNQCLTFFAHHQAAAHHTQRRHGKVHVSGPFRRP
ncbi:hypothetical protein D3C76_1657340 [compost metagenome]